MPELPEVEAARRMLDEALVGKTITKAEAREDDIVFEGVPPEAVQARLEGRKVNGTGRKGKFFWLQLDEGCLFLHFGMTGAILNLTPGKEKAVNYYRVRAEAIPGEDPRFMKLKLTANDGTSVAFVDGRRLGHIWFGNSPEEDRRVSALGPDAHTDLPTPNDLHTKIKKRKTPIKAILLNQGFLSGIGNWLADEVLLKARIAPARLASSLTEIETTALHGAIQDVVSHAVSVDADYQRFPDDWLFHVRWGGGRGEEMWQGHAIQRDTVGGRTTAWVPDLQK